MKTILVLLLVAVSGLSSFGEPPPVPETLERVGNAELIAFIVVTNVTTTSYTNATGQVVTVFTGDAVVERMLKGTPPSRLRVKQVILEGDSVWSRLGLRRFLALLKRSGDSYVPCGYYDLSHITRHSTHPGGWPYDDRVLWPHCNSAIEAADDIQRQLRKL